MNDQCFALKLEGIFHRVQENLAGKEFSQMRYDLDRNVYMLVAAGGQAKLTHDFLAAVASYARAVRQGEGDKEGAKKDVLAALDEFAAKIALTP
jgi:hypothetical protein